MGTSIGLGIVSLVLLVVIIRQRKLESRALSLEHVSAYLYSLILEQDNKIAKKVDKPITRKVRKKTKRDTTKPRKQITKAVKKKTQKKSKKKS